MAAKKIKKVDKGGGPNKKKGGGDNRLRRRAARDVRVSLRPYLQELRFQRKQARGDTRDYVNQVGSIYGGLDRELEQIGDDYIPVAQGITDQLQTDLGEWSQHLGSVSPAGELAAAAGLFGNIGAGAMGEIGAAQQRSLDWNTSSQRQGGIEQATTQRNALMGLQDTLQEINRRRLQATRGVGPDVLSRLDELRDFQQQMSLANREFRLRQQAAQAQRQFLIDQLGWKGFR